MDIFKKIGYTLIAIAVYGIIVTALFENAHVTPGEGPISYVLLGGVIWLLVIIWKKKQAQPSVNADKPTDSTKTTIENHSKPEPNTMDKTTENLLRNGFGSLGDTAKAYARDYIKVNPERTEDIYVFNNAFYLVIRNRGLVYERMGMKDDNLLIPAPIMGVKKIHKELERLEDAFDYNFRLDLPTMILYSMILESKKIREALAFTYKSQMQDIVSILFQEVEKVCPYQSQTDEGSFIWIHTALVYLFLMNVDRDMRMIIISNESTTN